MTILTRCARSAAILAALLGAASAIAAAPARWAVNPGARLGFTSALAGQAFHGAFRRWDAQIAFDPKQLAASKVVVTVDLASATAGDPSKDQAMPTADWFDVGHFPRAIFTSTGFKDLGNGRYQAQGTLSLRGVSRPLVLPFTLAFSGDQAKMTGSAVVNRSLFGVGQGQFKAADTVPFNVTLDIALTAHKLR
jgi:polyisoprenoid-binding protein YceI